MNLMNGRLNVKDELQSACTLPCVHSSEPRARPMGRALTFVIPRFIRNYSDQLCGIDPRYCCPPAVRFRCLRLFSR
jgi:hypothetical protein